MRVGDILEIAASAALVGALYLLAGSAGALVAAAACLAYLAQVYSDSPLPIPHRDRIAPVDVGAEVERQGPMFNCTLCGTSSPYGEIHQCPDGTTR